MNQFQMALLSRENNIKTMFNNLINQVEVMKENELKWCSIFFEFYSKHDNLTDNQKNILESIYERTMNKSEFIKAV